MSETKDGGVPHLTPHDEKVLHALGCGGSWRSGEIAHRAGFRNSLAKETAARHLWRLTRQGLAIQIGTRMFPSWIISNAGREALTHRSKGREGA